MDTKIIFKYNDMTILKINKDLKLIEIQAYKRALSKAYDCKVVDIEVMFKQDAKIVSEIDLTKEGMVYWKGFYPKIILGVKSSLIEGSDDYLDAINNNTLEDFLLFTN